MKAVTLLLVSSMILLVSCSSCARKQSASIDMDWLGLDIDWQGEDLDKILEPDPVPMDKLKLSTRPETNMVTSSDEYEENWCAA